MDTEENDISHEINNKAIENAELTDKEDIQPAAAETEPCGKPFIPPIKETVEILSVEVMQPAADVQQEHDKITDTEVANVPPDMEVDNDCDVNGRESNNSSNGTIINPEQSEILQVLQKNESVLPISNNSLEVLTNVNIENKISQSSETAVPSEEHMSAEHSELQKDSNFLGPVTNNEMEALGNKISNGSTVTETSAFTQASENIICPLSNRFSSPITPIEMNKIISSSTPNQDGEDSINTTTTSTNGLSLLAQYGSDVESNDSDNSSVIEVSTLPPQDYRSKVVEIDSESDSDSSDSDVEYLNELRKTIEKRMETVEDDDEDDVEEIHGDKGTRRKPAVKIKAKGELQLDDLPPIEDLHITVAEEECIVLGKIHSIVDQLVLVSALPNSVLVDLESVLFLEKGQKVLGVVFDVLGQVSDPLYCVRFNSNMQINEKNIKINDVVYLAPKTPYTQYIILSSIMRQKGSDASWENDLEPPPKFLDYSDDEEQQRARRQSKNPNRPADNNDPQKRQRNDSEGSQASTSSKTDSNSQGKQLHPAPNRGRGGPRIRGAICQGRQQHNPQYRNPHVANNHNPSSWHSNYYPYAYANMPPQNIRHGGGYPRMPAQGYRQAPMHQQMGMPYHSSSSPLQHPMPPNNYNVEHEQQFEPNRFSVRPPTIPGPYDVPPPQSRNE